MFLQLQTIIPGKQFAGLASTRTEPGIKWQAILTALISLIRSQWNTFRTVSQFQRHQIRTLAQAIRQVLTLRLAKAMIRALSNMILQGLLSS